MFELDEEDQRMSELRELQRHRAVFMVVPDHLRALFNVPSDVNINHVVWDEKRMCFLVYVYGERFEEVHIGCEAPQLPIRYELTQCDDNPTHIHAQIDFPATKAKAED